MLESFWGFCRSRSFMAALSLLLLIDEARLRMDLHRRKERERKKEEEREGREKHR